MNRREIVVKSSTRGPIVIDRSYTRVIFESSLRDIDGPAILIAATERKLDDIWIENASIAGCSVGIQAVGNRGISGLRIDNARVWDCQNGIQLPGIWDGVISQSKVWSCEDTGIDLRGSWNLHCDHVGASTCDIGFFLCKWSRHHVVAQVNRSCDIRMNGLEDCHLLAGSYFEDRPIDDDQYSGICLEAKDCRDCSIDKPIVQRSDWFENMLNCNVTLRSQRGVEDEQNNWRWRSKPSAVITKCNGGRWRWPTNGTIAIFESSVEQCDFGLPKRNFALSDLIPENSTAFVKASTSNGGRLAFNDERRIFPSSVMAWNSLYLPTGGKMQELMGKVAIEKAYYCPGQVSLNQVTLD